MKEVFRRPTTSGRVGHVAALDGVRGIAVLSVVVYHLDPDVLPGGFLGVSLFFTLSGFLITNLLLAEWRSEGTVDLGRFWQRRFRRLLPASLAGIGLVVALSPAWDADQLDDLPGDVFASLTYVANWRFIAGGDRYGAGFEEPSPLLHYWSLAIEEQFYLLVGALTLFLVAGRTLRRWIVVFGAILVASVVATVVLHDPLNTDRIYFGSLTRAAELVAGVLLALAIGMEVPRRFRSLARTVAPVGLVAAVVAFRLVELGDGGLYQGGLWLMALVSLALVAGALVDGPVQRLLQWRPLTALGLVSYGVYVYHWPVFVWLDADTTGLSPWPLAILRLVVTAAFVTLSFVLLERPIREGRLSGSVALAGAAVVTVALAAGGWAVSRDADSRAVAGEAPAVDLGVEVLGVVETAVEPVEPDASVERSADTATTTTTTTTTTPPPTLTSAIAMGDSLMDQAFPTIADRFARSGVAMELIGGAGETLMTAQGEWRGELVDAIAAVDPDVVILESCCGTGDPRRPDPYLGADGVELVPDSPEIWEEWERLALEYTEIARSSGALVMWVLSPPAETNGYYGPIEPRIAVANAIYERIAACSEMVGVIDWSVLSGPDGGYADALPDARGDLVRVRSQDGLHFTEDGQALLADLTRVVVRNAWTGRSPSNGVCAEPVGG